MRYGWPNMRVGSRESGVQISRNDDTVSGWQYVERFLQGMPHLSTLGTILVGGKVCSVHMLIYSIYVNRQLAFDVCRPDLQQPTTHVFLRNNVPKGLPGD